MVLDIQKGDVCLFVCLWHCLLAVLYLYFDDSFQGNNTYGLRKKEEEEEEEEEEEVKEIRHV